jgi:uncharacterized repeat protein (TIGR03803 family)
MCLNLHALFVAALCFFLSFHNARGQGGQMWGMVGDGGPSKLGMIFKAGPTANSKTIVHNFESKDEGSGPGATQLLKTPGGLFFGVTMRGGENDMGALYTFDPSTNAYAKKIDFDGANGSYPGGTLTLGSNGKIYGTTWYGGDSDKGGIFEYDLESEVLSLKIHFTGVSGQYGGCHGIAEGVDGKFYGVRYNGGSQFKGVIFVFDRELNTYTELFHFTDDAAHGRGPMGVLLADEHGRFYGTAEGGGTGNSGVIFRYDAVKNTFTKKIDIAAINGAYPRGYLTPHPNGKLYGVTQSGGTGTGVLFEYDTLNNVYQKRADFGFNHRANVGVVVAANEKIYGVTQNGGLYAAGSLFEYDPENLTYEYKYSFSTDDGDSQYGTVALGNDGKLYGTTSGGSVGEGGSIFDYDTETEILTKRAAFNPAPLGGQPYGALTEASNGKMYGLTAKGGSSGYGVLFELNPSGNTLTKQIDFTGTNGKAPRGNLLLASNGKLYGMTSRGGEFDNGVLFEFSPTSGDYEVKVSFNDEDGMRPEGSLTESSNGKLYGLTTSGGSSGAGVVFEYTLDDGSYSKKADFNDENGAAPKGGLLQYTNGKFYGLTYYGGTQGSGVIFEFDPESGTIEKKIDFTYENGANPVGGLLLASNGKLYGVTWDGGSFGDGVLFEYVPEANTFSIKHEFNEEVMGRPAGTPIESSNGKLYGMTASPSETGEGAIFSFTLSTGAVQKVSDFSYATGSPFFENSLTFVKSTQTIAFPEISQKFLGDQPITLQSTTSGQLPITYESSNPSIASIEGNVITMHKTGTVSITASQAGSTGYKPAASIERSLLIKLSAPVLMNAKDITETGFTMEWNEVIGAVSGYEVDVSSDNFETFLDGYESKIMDETTLVITGLSANTSYRYRVRAIGETETSVNSTTITVLTMLAPVAEEATDIKEDGFTANWNSVEHASTYALEISSDNFGTTLAGIENTAATSKAISGLQAGTEYKYRVKARNENGASLYSNIITVSTLAPSIDATTVAEAIEISQIAFTATWVPVSKAAHYIFELSDDDFETLIIGFDPKIVTDTFLVAEHLTANKNYKYRIKAANDDVVSAYSNVISVSTLAKISQTITFATIGDKALGENNFAITATSSSGLDVSFNADGNKIEVTGGEVKILEAGAAQITATQTGNEIYASAKAVTQTFCVNPAIPVIRFSDVDKVSLEIEADEKQSIEWFRDDALINSADAASLVIATNGIYTATVTIDGCTSESDEFSVLLTGNEILNADNFEIHPNPVSEKLYVVIPPFNGPADIKIISTTGVEAKSFSTSKIHNEVDVKDFKPGMYLVRIVTLQRVFNGKFLKK